MTDEEKAEARARRAAERAAQDVSEQQGEAVTGRIEQIPVEYRGEQHLLEDLVATAPGILGISGESLAGAIAAEGWEMTQNVTLDQVRTAVQSYLTTPA